MLQVIEYQGFCSGFAHFQLLRGTKYFLVIYKSVLGGMVVQ